MANERATVLVVERSGHTRDRVGGWLEDAGYEVLDCPGPIGPDYRCVASRGQPCPLVHAADAVVLDLWLESDTVMEGTSGVDLLGYYVDSGLPVLALTHGSEPVHLFDQAGVATLAGPLDEREVVETVRALLGGRQSGELAVGFEPTT